MNTHVCPWWLGYFLLNPLRKYNHNPDKILGKYVKPGMKVIDYGSAMGYFSLPMARMVGETGKVYCFDIQQKMLSKLKKRAINAGLDQIIEPRLIDNNNDVYSDIKGKADFILLCAVAHEVPDVEKLFTILSFLLKENGLLLFMEPAGHVSENNFRKSLSFAEKAGLKPNNELPDIKNLKVLLRKEKLNY